MTQCATTLEGAATLQIARLEMLNAKAFDEWTPAGFALERQSLVMLKQVISLSRAGLVEVSPSNCLNMGTVEAWQARKRVGDLRGDGL